MIQRRGLITGFIALCIAGSFGTAKADETASAKKAIQAIYAKAAAAAAKKDANGMTAHFAPDYESIALDGTITKGAAIKSNLERFLQGVKSITETTSITKLTLKGGTATVLYKGTANIVVVVPQTKKEGRLVIERTGETQWEKKGGAWLARRAKTLTNKQSLDGKELSAPVKQPKKG